MPVFAILSLVLCVGCASDLLVFNSTGTEAKGVPVGTPVLVKVTTTTTYSVDPNNAKYSTYCVDDTSESYKVMPLGDLYFVTFDSAALGKSEFSIDFNDAGLLKTVKLNSDPKTAENIEAASKVISSIAEVAKVAAPAAMIADPTAQQKKTQHCIKKGETTRIERTKLP